jgi:hypothetical protein
MSKSSGLLILLFAASLALTQEAPKRQFTARELFYSATVTPSSMPARPQAPRKAPPQQAVRVPSTQAPPAPKPAAPPTSGTSAPVVEAAEQRPSSAPAPSEGPALGLKYTILKLIGNEMIEVPPTTIFRAKDRIQFSVQTNLPGYLYIISRGSSGIWKPMFPSAEVADGNNRVEPMRAYTMPPGTRIVFDEQVGTEKVFIIFSREPEQDLEKMIYSLQNPNAAPVAAPNAADVPVNQRQLVQYASVRIDDATVGRLRNVYSRDLIIEKVDPNTPGGEKKETAVYVVNPTGSASSRIVADINLEHQ